MNVASDDRAVDELYTAPPSEFVKARDDLAKQLKARGDAEQAKQVKALRRPTAAAWALNQLTRRHPQELEGLLQLGERLRHAQARALGGGGAQALKELLAERRSTVDKVARLAIAAIDDDLGQSGAAQRDALVASLEAAIADANTADELRAGHLAKELDAPSGFGDWTALPPDEDDADGDGGVQDNDNDNDNDDNDDEREAEEQRQQHERARRAAEAEVDKARRAHDEATVRVERLEDELATARRRVTETARVLDDAERTLRDLSREDRG